MKHMGRSMAVILSAMVCPVISTGLAQDSTEEESDIIFAPDDETAAEPENSSPPAGAAPASGEETPPPAEPAASQAAPAGEPSPSATAPTPDEKLSVQPNLAARRGEKVFGTYRVRLAFGQPEFDDGLKFYDELYGNERWYPTLMADWFAFDWYATIGLSFRMGYYTADGYAAKQTNKPVSDLEADDIEQDKNGPTSLTLVPLQACVAAEFTPFKQKWIVLDGWIGYERLYFQEVRGAESSSKTTSMLVAEDDDESDDTLTNRGFKNGTVVGLAANILLNPIDSQTASSMRGTMGLASVYLSPYVEIVRTTSDGGASFGRKVMGVAFTFESIR